MRPLSQQIKEKYQLSSAYHMTHGKNLRSIFHARELVARSCLKNQSIVDISNSEIQQWRNQKLISVSGRSIHDYVPLYLGFKTPMVACMQEINEKIVFLRFPLEILELGDVVISDGNARSDSTSFRIFHTIEDLDILDPKAINSLKYAHDPEFRRKKQAEILVPNHLPLEYLQDVICYSKAAQRSVIRYAEETGISLSVRVNTAWYFNPRGMQ